MKPIVLVLPNKRYKRYTFDNASKKMKLDLSVVSDTVLTTQEVEQFRTDPKSML